MNFNFKLKITLKVNALTVEEIVKIRDRFPWLDLQYAPDYQSQGGIA